MKLWFGNMKHADAPRVAVIFLLTGAILTGGCGNNKTQGTGNEPATSTSSKKEKKILYWRAPMDPTYTSDKPGKSPMGMDLIPVYEGEEQTGGPTIVIDPVTVQNMGVQTTPVQKVNLQRVIRTVGYLDYNEEKLQRVNIKFSGWVEKLYVNETGQRVRRGQPMLSIYSPDLVATQEEYLLAYRNSRKLMASSFSDISSGGRSLLESSRRRLLYWDIPEKQIRNLEEKGTVSKTVTLYAPSDGVVTKKMIEEGMRVTPGMDLYHLADLSTLWVYGQIYQYEVPFVKVGQPVEVQVSYIPGKTYKGKVDFVYPFLDEKTRNVNVRIVVPNANLELKPQMYATVQFRSSIGSNVIAIPSDAVIRTGTRNVVFVAKGSGKFEPRDVTLGPEGQNSLVQVLAGVAPGEDVVTSAQFMIDSESRLKEAIQKMLETKKTGSMQSTPEDSHDGVPGEQMDGSTHSTPENHKGQDVGEMPETHPTQTENVTDLVCGMSITPNEQRSFSYKGKKYYFCSMDDMELFKTNPEEYVPLDSRE
jgi:multidrug efflux pump subunit AcrA (membrane-fusion protein)/YHS domain-containing protein